MKRAVRIFLAILAVLLIVTVSIGLYQVRDRHPGYSLDLRLPKNNLPVSPIKVGLAAEKITPTIVDTWVDGDGNAQYEPSKGDTFKDNNSNGKFDAYWIAGYGNKRAAQGVHDDIWARAIVFDDGASCVALVVLDAIGMFNDDVITIREMTQKACPQINHVIVSSTHCHEVPDLMGLWGNGMFSSGVNKDYLRFVQNQAVKALTNAYSSRKTAILKTAQTGPVEEDLVQDSRPPMVLDNCIRMMKFEEAQTGKTMGIFLNFGNHPESLGGANLQITADFPHYWLDGIEQGIFYGNEKKRVGIGGVAIFANGAIGGLMTSMHCETFDPWLNKKFGPNEYTFERARAQGYRLAAKVLDQLEKGDWQTLEHPTISLHAKTFQLRVDNYLFKLGGSLGVMNRGFIHLRNVRSEVDLLKIGPAWFLTIPGEIYPEIVNDGIEAPEGRDYNVQPIEVPPIRKMMKGKINFIIGLANDEVGYILPKSEWDEKAPYTYGKKKYGEINSLGAETGPTIHAMAKELLLTSP